MPASFIPRKDRPQVWGQRASGAVAAAGGDPMDGFSAAIAATFGPSRIPNNLKMSVDSAARLGVTHPAVRARYHGFASKVEEVAGSQPTIGQALAVLIRFQVEGQRKRDRSFAALGYYRDVPLDLIVLEELILIVRYLRRFKSEADFNFGFHVLTLPRHLPITVPTELEAAE